MDALSALGAGNLVTPAGEYPANIVRLLERRRWPLSSEKPLQDALAKELAFLGLDVQREVRLSRDAAAHDAGALLAPEAPAPVTDIVDLMISDVAIEVKVKGAKREIFRQVERYCAYPQVAALILATRKSMSLPAFIAGKPCYVAWLGSAWI